MKLVIEIDLENDALQYDDPPGRPRIDGEEIQDILDEAAGFATDAEIDVYDERKLLDSNGNTVGTAKLIP